MKELIISRSAIKSNIAAVKAKAGNCSIIATLSGDANGLGLSAVAKLLYAEGIRSFAVNEPQEAAALRGENLGDIDILMLRSTSDRQEIETLLDMGVTATVGSQEAAVALSGIAESRSTVAEAQIRIDTGYSHYGFLPAEFDKIEAVFSYMGNIAVTGVYTQYDPTASHKAVLTQAAAFDGVIKRLRDKHFEAGVIHAAGSNILFGKKEVPLYHTVRIGCAWGGLVESPKAAGLTPAAKLRSHITEVHWVPAKTVITGSKKTKKPCRIGIVPMGYGDGFGVDLPDFSAFAAFKRVLLGDKATVRLADGKKLRILGQSGQHHMAVDLTHNDASVGDEVYADANPVFCSSAPKKYV